MYVGKWLGYYNVVPELKLHKFKNWGSTQEAKVI